MNTHWSSGFYLGILFGAISILIGVGLFVVGRLWTRRTPNSLDMNPMVVGFVQSALGVVWILATVGVWIAVMWPLSAEYHQWRYHQGTITKISSRLNGGDNTVNQRFVVKLTGQPVPLSCDDTRCALLKVGDTLGLSCKRHYQGVSGTAGYDCNYIKSSEDGQ